MRTKDTVLIGCEIICIGEKNPNCDLISCPLPNIEQEKCWERKQYEEGRKSLIAKLDVLENFAIDQGYKAGIKEVVEIATELLLTSVYDSSPKRLKWQAKLKEWGIE